MDDKKNRKIEQITLSNTYLNFCPFLEKSLNSSINFMTFKKNLRKIKLIYDIINIYL